MAIKVTVPAREEVADRVQLTLLRKDAEVLRRLMHSHAPGGDGQSLPKRINQALEDAGINMAPHKSWYD